MNMTERDDELRRQRKQRQARTKPHVRSKPAHQRALTLNETSIPRRTAVRCLGHCYRITCLKEAAGVKSMAPAGRNSTCCGLLLGPFTQAPAFETPEVRPAAAFLRAKATPRRQPLTLPQPPGIRKQMYRRMLPQAPSGSAYRWNFRGG